MSKSKRPHQPDPLKKLADFLRERKRQRNAELDRQVRRLNQLPDHERTEALILTILTGLARQPLSVRKNALAANRRMAANAPSDAMRDFDTRIADRLEKLIDDGQGALSPEEYARLDSLLAAKD